MRLLLIAYEWPPITAAQSLRWHYLAGGLVRLGTAVDVVCPRIDPPFPFAAPVPAPVTEHRVWPGPFVGISQVGARKGRPIADAEQLGQPWRRRIVGTLYGAARKLLDQLLFPDVRTEWYPFARRKLLCLLARKRFDVIVSSHEPGVDLLLGLLAQERSRLPWVVDLADPLCAPYSPRWRRWLDLWFEGHVLRKATKVILTTDRLKDVLMRRHAGVTEDKFYVLPQGGPDQLAGTPASPVRRLDKLRIVFTGNFYQAFRNPENLAEGLRSLNNPEISLTIAGESSHYRWLFDGLENVTFLGRIDHFECLRLQREADLLLNMGNAQSDQTPGKIYEYLVTGKPVLHIRGSFDDPTEAILKDYPCAFVADNAPMSIAGALADIHASWRQGLLGTCGVEPTSSAEKYGWTARARALQGLLESLIKPKT